MIETITIEGMPGLMLALNGLADGKYRKPAMQAIGEIVRAEAAPYPLLTMANSPLNPTGRWYQRGYGPRSRTGWSRETSEHLGKSWYISASVDQVEVGNKASYGIFVQGDEQTGFHGERGWKVLSVVARNKLDEAVEIIWKYVEKVWNA